LRRIKRFNAKNKFAEENEKGRPLEGWKDWKAHNAIEFSKQRCISFYRSRYSPIG